MIIAHWDAQTWLDARLISYNPKGSEQRMSALEQLVGNMTVAQLAEAAGMDIDAVVGLVLGQKRASAPVVKAAAPAAKGKGGRKPGRPPKVAAPEPALAATSDDDDDEGDGEGGGDGHNTRTRSGRQELDQAILDFLKSQAEPVRALDIRKGIGGTAAQIRTRLNYLIEKGRVTYKGRASGTRYRAK
jgi:hypothetical protein